MSQLNYTTSFHYLISGSSFHYLISGSSKDSVESHRMNHYIHGLQAMTESYDFHTKLAHSSKKMKKKVSRLSASKKKIKNFLYRKLNRKITDEGNSTKRTNLKNISGTGKKNKKLLSVRAGASPLKMKNNSSEIDDDESHSTRNKSDIASNATIRNSNNNSGDNNEKINGSRDENKKSKNGNIMNKNKVKNKKDSVFEMKKNSAEAKKDQNNIDESQNKKRENLSNDVDGQKKRIMDVNKKEKVKTDGHPTLGIHISTNLRLESALTLNLISVEKYDDILSSSPSDYTSDSFYCFI